MAKGNLQFFSSTSFETLMILGCGGEFFPMVMELNRRKYLHTVPFISHITKGI